MHRDADDHERREQECARQPVPDRSAPPRQEPEQHDHPAKPGHARQAGLQEDKRLVAQGGERVAMLQECHVRPRPAWREHRVLEVEE